MSTIFINMRNDIRKREKDILIWINQSQSKAFICKQLKCKPDTLNWWLKKLNIQYRGNQGGKSIKQSNKKKNVLEYIKSSHINSHKLRIKLIEDGIKKHICENCNRTKWLGTPIPLELHHIDGNRFNNNMDNLMIICPNCHSLTENNSGKNKGKY